MAIGDLNNDLKTGIVVANGSTDSSISVLLGKEDGTLQVSNTYPAGSNPWLLHWPT